jgi:hypothetical protein
VVDSVSLCLLFSADLPMKKSFIDFHMSYTVTAKDTRIMIKENIHSVLLDNNIKSHTVLFRFSDMVEAIAHVPFSMHQYYCTS